MSSIAFSKYTFYDAVQNTNPGNNTLFVITSANVESFGYCNDEERGKM